MHTVALPTRLTGMTVARVREPMTMEKRRTGQHYSKFASGIPVVEIEREEKWSVAY